MCKDDVRAGVIVLAMMLLALWIQQGNQRLFIKLYNSGFETGRTVERLIHEETSA